MVKRIQRFAHCFLVAVLIFQVSLPPQVAFADHHSTEQPSLVTSEGDTVLDTGPDVPTTTAPEGLADAIENRRRHPLDVFRVLEITAHPHRRPASIRPNLTIVIHSPGAEDRSFNLREFRSDQPGGAFHPFYQLPTGSTLEIQYQGTKLYDLHMPVRCVGAYQGQLFFLDEDSYINETGVHNVSYIDLPRFWPAIGRAEPPVFRMPIKGAESDTLSIDALGLKMGQTSIHPTIIRAFSEAQESVFNMMVSLVNPKTFNDTAFLVADFQTVFDRTLAVAGEDARAQMENAAGVVGAVDTFASGMRKPLETAGEITRSLAQVAAQYPRESQQEEKNAASTELLQAFLTNLQTHESFQKTLQGVATSRIASRKLLGRLNLLWHRLTLPQPDGAADLKKALAAAAYVGSLGFAGSAPDKEGFLQFINTKTAKIGAPLTAAAVFGMIYPEQALQLFEQTLNLGRMIVETGLGKASDMYHMSVDTFSATIAGFNPYVLYNTYLSEEHRRQFGIGLCAAFTTLGIALGVPHMTVNTVRLYHDLSEEQGFREIFRPREGQAPSLAGRTWNYFQQFRPRNFRERQDRVQQTYLQTLSDTEHQGEARTDGYSEEETQRVRDIISQVEESERTWIGSCWKAVSNWSWVKKFTGKKEARHRIDSLFGAMMHFCFSAASFTMSGSAYVKIWNGWFGFRSFITRPVVGLTFLTFPNYYRRLMGHPNGRSIVVPTDVNGGLRPFWIEYSHRVARLFGSEHYLALKAWESKILPVEAAIETEVIRASSVAMLHLIQDPRLLQRFIATNGIDRVGDSTLYELSAFHRRVFREYHAKVSERAMAIFLDEVAATSGVDVEDMDDPSALDLKARTLRAIDSIKCTAGDATRIVAQATSEVGSIQEIAAGTETYESTIKRYRNALNYRNMAILDPSNSPQIARLQAVNRQSSKPQAMARAVRSAMVSFAVDKPMELLLLFICLAGVKTGINVPLHDEAFGPNSMFHLGIYPFFYGMVVTTIMSAMADIWMKLQVDEGNKEEDFGVAPEGEDTKLSRFGWYRKQFMRSDTNTWWQNQKHNTMLIIGNFRAALVTYAVTELITLGRMDLDTIVAGYLFAFGLTGFEAKLDQVFEFTTGYDKAKFPAELVRHPEAQGWFSKRNARWRVKFNVANKLRENLMYNFIGTLTTIQSVVGPRSFSRWLFGGYTPTEWAFSFFTKAGDTLSFLPGAEAVANGCKWFFSNNYTDGIIEGLKPPKKP